MIALLFLTFVVAVKIYKKSSPNGKITVYLGKRDFLDHLDYVDPIEGVVVVESDYLKGRRVFGQLTTTYRYGREEDEVMGVKFSKEMCLAKEQIVPSKNKGEMSPMQERLVKKLGSNAFPFTFSFPSCSPSSVTLQPGESDSGKPLGVEYTIKAFVGEDADDKNHKRSTVALAVKKGKINLEVTLDKEIYYHGEKVCPCIIITNNSRKTVKNIKVYVVQHCEVTMVNAQFSKFVASMETREGCPVTPGASLSKTFYLVPLASSNKDRRGIALDGHLRDDDVNLASSTLVIEGKTPSEALGIVISYSVRVILNCGTLGGELVTDVPFKLLHPAPGSIDNEKAQAKRKAKPLERSRFGKQYTNDDDDNIIFEDFARLRQESVDQP
ncbi:hypothetical protein J437_LFUL013210 [Ladona fulva]|uniref:Arrestin C-terminal-like domain-containing protein n=1 Tax=Ladona fulva TaxID=123851 RepID=A0A8K0KMJ7_LADFU|nr:hypothetical protein J437_LFUL013210 [Ladona fulva]